MSELSFGQRIDHENGLIECWFTWAALDKIKEMDLSDKVIWMWGAGLGDVWLSKRCKELHVVERNEEWLARCVDNKLANNAENLKYHHRPCNDCEGMDWYYCAIPEEISPDVIIVDDAYRYECIVKAVDYANEKRKKITLIVDNFQQDYVFVCPAAEEVLKGKPRLLLPCPTHTNHEGRPWQTAIFYL